MQKKLLENNYCNLANAVRHQTGYEPMTSLSRGVLSTAVLQLLPLVFKHHVQDSLFTEFPVFFLA